jgi:RIO-like serine/threonine protein kinase
MMMFILNLFTVHKDAYENVSGRLLHQDISSVNILIGPDDRGRLIDWEYVKKIADESQKSRAWRIVRRFLPSR